MNPKTAAERIAAAPTRRELAHEAARAVGLSYFETIGDRDDVDRALALKPSDAPSDAAGATAWISDRMSWAYWPFEDFAIRWHADFHGLAAGLKEAAEQIKPHLA
jgi:hypothetical protein